MENLGSKLAEWIKNAELINKSALCKEVGIDRANLDKYIQRGYIPEKFVGVLGKALYKYGYSDVIEKKVEENNKPQNKKRILKEREGVEISIQDLTNNTPKTNFVINTTPAFKNEVEKMIWEEEQKLLNKKSK